MSFDDQSHVEQELLGLIRTAEWLAHSENWKTAGGRQDELLAKWKSVSRRLTDRRRARELWERFDGARQRYYDRRRVHFAKVDRARAQALREKRRLCERAERLASSTDWKATGEKLRRLVAEWKAVGHAGEDEAALRVRFQAARESFYVARERHRDGLS